MALLMAAAGASSAVSATRKAQLAGCGLGMSSRTAAAVAPVLPVRTTGRRSGRRSGPGTVRASSSGENMMPDSAPGAGSYGPVDANMMVLRRRIEGMRMKESFIETPEEWMEWEKSCYNTYRADVNIFVASLQSRLLGMRPSVVLYIVSFLFAVTPIASLLLLSALGCQLYSLNSAVLDLLAPCSAAAPPPL